MLLSLQEKKEDADKKRELEKGCKKSPSLGAVWKDAQVEIALQTNRMHDGGWPNRIDAKQPNDSLAQ